MEGEEENKKKRTADIFYFTGFKYLRRRRKGAWSEKRRRGVESMLGVLFTDKTLESFLRFHKRSTNCFFVVVCFL
jgi:hypothetical protein